MGQYREIQLQMSDGYQCYGRYWRNDQALGAVVYLHGIQSHGLWFEDSCRALQESGFAVLLMDRRGSGQNRQARGDVPSMSRWLDDVDSAVELLLEQCRCSQVHVVGVSWGGKLALGFYRYRPAVVASMTLIAPGIFPRMDLPVGRKLAVLGSRMVRPGKLFDIPLNDPELFTGNPARQQFIREDCLRLRQVTSRFLVCSRQLDWVVRALGDRPVAATTLFLAGRERIIDNAATLGFFRSLRTFDKTLCYYPQAGHTLEFEADSEPFKRNLCQCLEQHT